ncbi:Carboxylesterase and related proteins [Ceraceosorus bombacis]|uniref:Carboxylesterase and related proteins n=1 Tax=Ceraceosorus bombacis TaxID=401625 RepID=A0A0N7L9N0_9BASI|nr:Carboxylesterase and related proteins [Ceraceosorus bombacis]
MPRTQSRISRLVASFLRIVLVPTILFGVPLWPFLGLLCAVPFVGIITIPLFLLLSLALRFRRMGYCVVVPDISYFPAARMRASVIDLRLVLRWVGESCARYGGDPSRIHLMGHGLSAHLALLTLAQEAVVLSPSSGEVTFPSAAISSSPTNAQQHAVGREQSLANAEASIPNGLRRVEIYSPDVAIPPIAGLILVSGVSDVIKGFRNESDRGIEHLSVLRRACGPSHTACLLHSPAHLIYAAKNIVDASLFPPKILLIHGGKDSVVDVSQSTLLKTLLVGCGVGSVRLRAYKQLGHAEAIAAMFLGMGKAATRYQKQLLNDIADFVQQ